MVVLFLLFGSLAVTGGTEDFLAALPRLLPAEVAPDAATEVGPADSLLSSLSIGMLVKSKSMLSDEGAMSLAGDVTSSADTGGSGAGDAIVTSAGSEEVEGMISLRFAIELRDTRLEDLRSGALPLLVAEAELALAGGGGTERLVCLDVTWTASES